MASRAYIIITLLILACICSNKAGGQDIIGQITDSTSGQAIEGVSVSLKGTVAGTVSDAEGSFSLAVVRFPATLVFRHLCYETVEITVSHASQELHVGMKLLSHPLGTISIKPEPVTEFMKERSFEILDYEFLGDDILLLANRNGSMFNSCLVLVNAGGDTLNTLDVSRPEMLYRDFGDHVHFISRQSAFMVAICDSLIRLAFTAGHDEFFNTYPYVVDRRSSEWILKNYYHRNQELKYFLYSENKMQYDEFCSITNEAAIQRSRWGAYFDGTEADEHFAAIIINRPLFAPMFRKGDSLVLFNYNDLKIEYFGNNGAELGSVTAAFMKQKGCMEEIFADRLTGKFYVRFQKNGISSLHLIDLRTGAATTVAKIPGFIYIEKIRVHNNEIFFLYRDKTEQAVKRMYRMKL